MNAFLLTCRHALGALLFAIWLINPCQAANLVYLNTNEGAQRLVHAELNKPYFLIAPYVDTQENMGFCAPASIAAVLNSLPGIPRPTGSQYQPYRYFTQTSLFNPTTNRIKRYDVVAHGGLTLAEASKFLDAHGVSNRIYYGSDLSVSQLRTLIKHALNNPHARIIADFDRRIFGQAGAGHYSPLVAYDGASDSVLIADVAKFKYPFFWVPVETLLASIRTIDAESGRSRGLIIATETTD